MGWHYVGRVRNRDLCRFGEHPWQPVKDLYALASASPKRLGYLEMTRSAPWPAPLYAACAAGTQTPARHRDRGPGQAQPAKRATRKRALAAGQQPARGAVECGTGRGDLPAAHREARHERRFQSNSVKDKHVLSLWRLRLEYIRTYAGDISRERLRELELALRREVHRQAQELG
ncbi:hypothetical protein SAMN04244579_04766 [Azotobacter beijerinckii]|uniref:Uncharacterized protein n=1 Tax=Azotobacter beijerinckii TaxID=170623 RepID=A0A1H6ZZ74_9GAMM|nr:hypothetical protein SAMN04244579_04766 [Azotobacter beijerinckii]